MSPTTPLESIIITTKVCPGLNGCHTQPTATSFLPSHLGPQEPDPLPSWITCILFSLLIWLFLLIVSVKLIERFHFGGRSRCNGYVGFALMHLAGLQVASAQETLIPSSTVLATTATLQLKLPTLTGSRLPLCSSHVVSPCVSMAPRAAGPNRWLGIFVLLMVVATFAVMAVQQYQWAGHAFPGIQPSRQIVQTTLPKTAPAHRYHGVVPGRLEDRRTSSGATRIAILLTLLIMAAFVAPFALAEATTGTGLTTMTTTTDVALITKPAALMLTMPHDKVFATDTVARQGLSLPV